MTYRSIPTAVRLKAMLVDHFLMCCITVLFAIPLIVYAIIEPLSRVHFDPENYKKLTYLVLFGSSLFFCKDSLNGQSFAKRKFRLKVIDVNTGNAASPLQCFVRNVFCLLLPFELLFSYENVHRRIGDKIAGTELIREKLNADAPKVRYWQAAVCVSISFAFHLGIFLLIDII